MHQWSHHQLNSSPRVVVSLSLQERQERAREALQKCPSQQRIVRKVSEGIMAKQQQQQQLQQQQHQDQPEEVGGLHFEMDQGPRKRRTDGEKES